MTTATLQLNRADALLPRPGRILEVTAMTERERFFRIELDRPLNHQPGQFVMVSLLGVGEAPISISCGPRTDNHLEMLIRNTGSLTQAIHCLEAGQYLGIRGPFGAGFRLDEFSGRHVLLVCGGLGLAPMRSLIQPLVNRAELYAGITIIAGFRTPREELYRQDLKQWAQCPGVQVIRMVNDANHLPWSGAVGLVTEPIAGLPLDLGNTLAVLCGPPVMYKFVIMELVAKGLQRDQIFVDLERRMKCGIGKCGHCQINQHYCCQEGPVFRYSALESIPEAL